MTKSKAIKISACFFFLWGLLHFLVGYPAIQYLFDGPVVVLNVFKINPLQNEGFITSNLENATYLGLNFLYDLMVFGILGMWLGWMMWKGRYILFCYRLNFVILGLVDIAFIGCMVLTGISPLGEAIWGPLLYVLGILFGGYGVSDLYMQEGTSNHSLSEGDNAQT